VGSIRSPQNKSVHYRQPCRHIILETDNLEDVDATAWSLHRRTAGGNVPTLRSTKVSAGQRHESGCDTHAPTGFRSGLLAGHRARAMKSDVSQVYSCTASRALWAGALSCWKVKKSPDTSRMADRSCWWSKTCRYYGPFTFVRWLMKNKSLCPRLLTATDTITDRENVERVLTTQRHFRTSDCSKQRCIGNRDIISSLFEY